MKKKWIMKKQIEIKNGLRTEKKVDNKKKWNKKWTNKWKTK